MLKYSKIQTKLIQSREDIYNGRNLLYIANISILESWLVLLGTKVLGEATFIQDTWIKECPALGAIKCITIIFLYYKPKKLLFPISGQSLVEWLN